MSLAAVVAPLQPGRMVPEAQKGKVAHLSASRKRQPSPTSQEARWETVFSTFPEVIVPDVFILARSSDKEAADCCRPFAVRPSSTVSRLALAAPEIGRIVLVLPLLRKNASDFASRSKAKAKPQWREPAGSSTRTLPFGKRTLTDVVPGEYSLSDFDISKKLIHLLRHGSLPRENDGAIQFWRIEDNLQKHFLHCHHWSDDKWKKNMAEGGRNKKRYQYCTDSSGEIFTSELFKVIQDAVLLILHYKTMIPDDFFKYIYHVGCAINLHSIINSGLIPGGQN